MNQPLTHRSGPPEILNNSTVATRDQSGHRGGGHAEPVPAFVCYLHRSLNRMPCLNDGLRSLNRGVPQWCPVSKPGRCLNDVSTMHPHPETRYWGNTLLMQINPKFDVPLPDISPGAWPADQPRGLPALKGCPYESGQPAPPGYEDLDLAIRGTQVPALVLAPSHALPPLRAVYSLAV